MAVHSNDEKPLRNMLGVPTKYKLPDEFVSIYDNWTELKKIGGDNGSYTTRELVSMVREYQRDHGKWKAPPEAPPAPVGFAQSEAPPVAPAPTAPVVVAEPEKPKLTAVEKRQATMAANKAAKQAAEQKALVQAG